jgi:hypothetical protein
VQLYSSISIGLFMQKINKFKRRVLSILLIIIIFSPLYIAYAEETYDWKAFSIDTLNFKISLPKMFTNATMRKYAPDDNTLAAEKSMAAGSAEKQKLYENMTKNNVYMYALNGDETWKFQLWIAEDHDSRAIGSFWYYTEKEITKWATANTTGDYSVSTITLNDVKFALQTYKTKTMNMGLLYTIHDGKRYNFMLYTTRLDSGIKALIEMLKGIGKKAAFNNIVPEANVTLNKRNLKVSGGKNGELEYTVPTGWGKIGNDMYTDLDGNRLYVLQGRSSNDIGASFENLLSKFPELSGIKTKINEPAQDGLNRFAGYKITGTANRAKDESRQLLAYLYARGSEVCCVLYIGVNNSLAMKDCGILANSVILPKAKITNQVESKDAKASGYMGTAITINRTSIVIAIVLTVCILGLGAALAIVLRKTRHRGMGKHMNLSKEVQK